MVILCLTLLTALTSSAWALGPGSQVTSSPELFPATTTVSSSLRPLTQDFAPLPSSPEASPSTEEGASQESEYIPCAQPPRVAQSPEGESDTEEEGSPCRGRRFSSSFGPSPSRGASSGPLESLRGKRPRLGESPSKVECSQTPIPNPNSCPSTPGCSQPSPRHGAFSFWGSTE